MNMQLMYEECGLSTIVQYTQYIHYNEIKNSSSLGVSTLSSALEKSNHSNYHPCHFVNFSRVMF